MMHFAINVWKVKVILYFGILTLNGFGIVTLFSGIVGSTLLPSSTSTTNRLISFWDDRREDHDLCLDTGTGLTGLVRDMACTLP